MSDYDRSTTAMTVATVPEPIRSAVREKAEAPHLTVAEDAHAFLTHSRKRKKGGERSRTGPVRRRQKPPLRRPTP